MPTADIRVGNEAETVTLSADDAFGKFIERFCRCVLDGNEKKENYKEIHKQAKLADNEKGE